MKHFTHFCLGGLGIAGLLVPTLCQGQSTEFRHFVWMNGKHCVNVAQKVPETKTQAVSPATTVTETTIVKDSGGKTYKLERATTYPAATTLPITAEKTYVIPLQSPRKKANITQSRDTLYINYWLFSAASSDDKCKNNCAGVPENTLVGFTTPCWINAPGSTPTYIDPATNAPYLAGGGTPVAFNRKNTYFIKLNDRQARTFSFQDWQLSALTIPFQYRPAYKRNDLVAEGEFNADLNIGASLTFKKGWVTYSYNKIEKAEPRKLSLALGPFLGVTRVELNKNNTVLAAKPLTGDDKRHLGVISTGLGLTMNIRELQIGLFAGRDLSKGALYDRWDYRKRVWYGIGFGYGLVFLKKAAE